MRDKVLLSVGAQDKTTNEYQVSDLDEIDFYWKHDQLDVDAVLRPGLDTPFSSCTFRDFETGAMPEIPIQVDDEQNSETSSYPLLPTTPVSERPNKPAVIMRSPAYDTVIGKVFKI